MTNPIDHHQPAGYNRPLPKEIPAGILKVTGNDIESQTGAMARIELGPTGNFGLSHTESGRTIRLASAVNPAAEDLSLVERFNPKPGEGVVCIGLGLGYQLEELARRLRPDDPIWVFESRPELAAAALMSRDLEAVLSRPGFRLFIGPWNGQPPFGAEETPPGRVLWRPAAARYFAGEYPWFKTPGTITRLKPSAPRLLLFQSGYYLDRELNNAAKALNLETAVWNFERGETADGDNFKALLELIKNFRPDLALTVNHLGFDAEGLMDDLFSRLRLPVASWFVDSPAFILGDHRPGSYVSAFSWDMDYLELLKDKGFVTVRHLPLATDETFFRPDPGSSSHRPLAFVGDSLTMATAKYMLKLGLRADSKAFSSFLDDTDKLAEGFLSNSDLLPDSEGLKKLAASAGLTAGPEQLADLGALVTWRASRIRRREVLAAVKESGLTVAGDKHWSALLNINSKKVLPPLDYYTELNPFYQSAQVNLNITSAQMKTGLNQRVFDVPASGAFLLTDHKEQLFELFEPNKEVITYHDPQEARQLAAWYARHPAERESIVRAAHRRVTGCHLYRHRLNEILKTMSV